MYIDMAEIDPEDNKGKVQIMHQAGANFILDNNLK